MDKETFKQNLIKEIQATDNNELLEAIYWLLALDSDEFQSITLSEQEKRSITKGREDIRNGNALTEEQANNEIDEWLKE